MARIDRLEKHAVVVKEELVLLGLIQGIVSH